MRPQTAALVVALGGIVSLARADASSHDVPPGQAAKAANATEPLCGICPCHVTKDVTYPDTKVEARCVSWKDLPEVDVTLLIDRSTSFNGTLNDSTSYSRALAVATLFQGISSTNRLSQELNALGLLQSSAGMKPIRCPLPPSHIQFFPDSCGPKQIWATPIRGPASKNSYTPFAGKLDEIRSLIAGSPVQKKDTQHLFIVVTDGYNFPNPYGAAASASSSNKLSTKSRCIAERANLKNSVASFLKEGSGRHLLFFLGSPIFQDCSDKRNLPNPGVCDGVTDPLRCRIANATNQRRPDMGSSASDFIAKVRQEVESFIKSIQGNAACVEYRRYEVKGEPKTVYTPVQEFPDISFKDAVLIGDDTRLRCSGVVVGPSAVLTAAHCLPATRVFVGESLAEQGKHFIVAESQRHPNAAVDAALLRTKRPLEITPKPWRSVKDSDAPTGPLRLVGFGAADSRGIGPFGRRKAIDLSSSGWGCTGARVTSTGCQPLLEMVVPGTPGGDSCAGDSGGPLYELIGDGTACSFRLVGITSRRVGDARVQCGDGGIYVRVDRISDWLKATLGSWSGGRAAQGVSR